MTRVPKQTGHKLFRTLTSDDFSCMIVQNMANTRDILVNAFRPGTAIDTPTQFAGRKSEIKTLVDALYKDGSCPIIFGHRGLGKTSMAYQIERIALGDTELLQELGLSERSLPEDDCFLTFYFTCTDDIKTKDMLVQGIINNAVGTAELNDLQEGSAVATTVTRKLNLKIYEDQVTRQYSNIDGYAQLSVEERLEAVIRQAHNQYGKRVLIIVDELDRVEDLTGLASLIKKLSCRDTRFLLVGIGQNVSALLDDHLSLERQLIEVLTFLMKDADCAAIVEKAEASLHHQGVDMSFSPDVIRGLVMSAGGFPWFIHSIGQAALLSAHESGGRTVMPEHLAEALDQLGRKEYWQRFYDKYSMAVRDSRPREILLRLLAKWRGFDIPTSDIYPVARTLGIQKPSGLTKDLQREKYGRVLVKPPYAPRRIYRFENATFKRYVDLRPSIYSNVKDIVDSAWEARMLSIAAPD